MTGNELLSALIRKLNIYLVINSDEVLEDIDINGNLLGAFEKLKNQNLSPNFIILINSLIGIANTNIDDFLNNHYTALGQVERIDFSQDLAKKNRAFTFSDNDFGFFSSKALILNNTLVDLSKSEHSKLWKQLQEYLVLCFQAQDNTSLETLLECIRDNNINWGFVINKKALAFNHVRHYSYIYLSFLNNGGRIALPSNMQYQVPKINTNLSLNSQNIYEQYFDVYDVINEINQAPDLISRFLKVYHTLEYLVYRVYLVELTTRVGTNKIFVREFANSAESMKKGEKESFIRNFKKIFNTDLAAIRSDLTPHATPNAITFLTKNGIVPAFNTTRIDSIATFIYGIRCSIVHNKESEFHISLVASEDYTEIIPLLRQSVATIERLVIDKLATRTLAISYPHQQMNLY